MDITCWSRLGSKPEYRVFSVTFWRGWRRGHLVTDASCKVASVCASCKGPLLRKNGDVGDAGDKQIDHHPRGCSRVHAHASFSEMPNTLSNPLSKAPKGFKPAKHVDTDMQYMESQ